MPVGIPAPPGARACSQGSRFVSSGSSRSTWGNRNSWPTQESQSTPEAKLVEKDDNGGSDRANVNISTPFFGLKLVVVKYASDDAPQKLVDFYTNDLKRYGKILQCNKSGSDADWHVGIDSHDKPGHRDQLSCSGDGKGDTVELKVGSNNNAP